jgi:leucyl-tRNA---protein transferase
MQQPKVYLLEAQNLDNLLAQGYYRYGCTMFTTNTVETDGISNKAHWLRYLVPQYSSTPQHQRLLRASKQFTVHIQAFELDSELEDLHQQYRNSLPFEISSSLAQNLYYYSLAHTEIFVFKSFVVKIYDKDTLVAAGIFDHGTQAIAGIINMYHPAYKKHSLGKLLVLHKMQYCKQHGIAYYYPGYVVENNPRFDYKFFLGKEISQLWDPTTLQWYSAALQPSFQHL